MAIRQSIPFTERINEGDPLTVMTRITDNSGSTITGAQIGTITYSVYDITTGYDQIATPLTGSIAKSGNWFDTYQINSKWTKDKTGFNFRYEFAASTFISSLTRLKGSRFRVEIRGTPVVGQPFWIAILDVEVCDSLSLGG